MSTHNICFYAEIRKIICGYPLLSGVMLLIFRPCQDLQHFRINMVRKSGVQYLGYIQILE